MRFKDLRLWPIVFGSISLLAAAVINYRSLLVPNWLSLGSILGAWLVALLVSARLIPMPEGGVGSCLASMLIGGLLLLPFYSLGYLGAGCVKMQMAFAAWIGCAARLPRAMMVATVGTVSGGMVTAIAIAIFLKVGWLNPGQLFPAQVTLSLGTIGGLLACLYILVRRSAPGDEKGNESTF